jgi:hypothetical protein
MAKRKIVKRKSTKKEQLNRDREEIFRQLSVIDSALRQLSHALSKTI